MMNLNKFAFTGAIALAGAMGFTACSSDDDITSGQNPTFDGETVKTQFAISIPGVTNGTRLTEDIVQGQNAPVFRGMQSIRLIPFTVTPEPSAITTSPVDGNTPLSDNAIVLADLTKDGLDKTAGDDKFRIYDIRIPMRTNAFLFYGEGLRATSTGDKENGALVPSYSTSGWNEGSLVNTITFSLKPIYTATDAAAEEATVLAALNGIAGTTGWASAGDGTGLKNHYTSFTSLKAGSSNNVLLAVQDLYNTVKGSTVEDFGTDGNAGTGLKDAIASKIEEYFTSSGAAVPYTLAWTTDPNYPGKYGLPDGAVQVKWEDNAFSYVKTNIGYGDNLSIASLNKYVYPAALYYFANSALKASATPVLETASGNSWDEILGNASYTDWAVGETTQSVAMAKMVQYGVASLKVNAKFANGEILDNGANWPSTAEPVGQNAVTIPSDGMTLTGILIGGQKNVDWKFQTNKTSEEYTIYDASLGTVGVKTGTASPAYSLALETVGNSAADGEKVRFALEFVNNTEDAFVGKDGIVPVGGKFYLVGELANTTDHQKVFEQDHTTTANVTINSLKSAYNCIPDLRSPQLEFGLAVDLEWQEGLVDEVVIE